MFHNLIEESPPHVPSNIPFGWKLIQDIQSLWPSPCINNSPVGNFHNFQVLSSLAVPIIAFFGLKSIEVTPFKWPGKLLNTFIRWETAGKFVFICDDISLGMIGKGVHWIILFPFNSSLSNDLSLSSSFSWFVLLSAKAVLSFWICSSKFSIFNFIALIWVSNMADFTVTSPYFLERSLYIS